MADSGGSTNDQVAHAHAVCIIPYFVSRIRKGYKLRKIKPSPSAKHDFHVCCAIRQLVADYMNDRNQVNGVCEAGYHCCILTTTCSSATITKENDIENWIPATIWNINKNNTVDIMFFDADGMEGFTFDDHDQNLYNA